MDASKNEAPKLSDLVMCGDHPSFTKTELNVKEPNSDNKERDKLPITFPRLSSAASALSRSQLEVSRPASASAEHRALEKRAQRSVEALPTHTTTTHAPRQFVQAAIGSFRWPPYLLCVWVCVLALTHALHALVTLLEHALPILKKSCQYFRMWTEASWRSDTEPNRRMYRVVLALCTGMLYLLYVILYALHAVTLWLVEPLHNELDVTPSSVEVDEVKVTNYNIEEVKSQ